MWLLLSFFGAIFIAEWLPLLCLAAWVVLVFFIYAFAQALKSPRAPTYLALALVPIATVPLALLLSRDATKLLRARGLRVGFMGVRRDDLEHLLDRATPPPKPTPP